MQFMNLLKTLGPDSPIVPMVMSAIIENSGLSNREELMQQMAQMSQPNPMAETATQLQLQRAQLELADLDADVKLKQAKTAKEITDAQLKPAELQANIAASASKYLGNGPGATDEFEQRVKVANLALKEKDIDTRREIANLQIVAARQS
jgi:hypothetical protein